MKYSDLNDHQTLSPRTTMLINKEDTSRRKEKKRKSRDWKHSDEVERVSPECADNFHDLPESQRREARGSEALPKVADPRLYAHSAPPTAAHLFSGSATNGTSPLAHDFYQQINRAKIDSDNYLAHLQNAAALNRPMAPQMYMDPSRMDRQQVLVPQTILVPSWQYVSGTPVVMPQMQQSPYPLQSSIYPPPQMLAAGINSAPVPTANPFFQTQHPPYPAPTMVPPAHLPTPPPGYLARTVTARPEESPKKSFQPSLPDRLQTTFPEKLYQLINDLEKEGKEDIVSWIFEGKAFKIHQPEVFIRDTVPKYFRHKSLDSFKRQLNNYCFERVHRRGEVAIYAHEFFQRGRPELLHSIHRVERSTDPDVKPRWVPNFEGLTTE